MPMSGKEMLKLYLADGWTFKSQKGSHVKVEKNGDIQIIPMHRELKKGLERSLLKKFKK